MLSYEERRARNVARNSAMFGHLGLETAAATVLPGGSAKPSAPKRRKTAKAAPREPTRRSSRARGAAPLYTGERIDHFGDDEEGGSSEYDGSESDGGSGGGGGGAAARRRAAAQLKEQRRKQNDVDEVLKASAQWLAESRAALLGQLGGGSVAVVVKAEPGSACKKAVAPASPMPSLRSKLRGAAEEEGGREIVSEEGVRAHRWRGTVQRCSPGGRTHLSVVRAENGSACAMAMAPASPMLSSFKLREEAEEEARSA